MDMIWILYGYEYDMDMYMIWTCIWDGYYSTWSFPEGLRRSDELPAKRTRHDLAQDAVARKMTLVGCEPTPLRTGA